MPEVDKNRGYHNISMQDVIPRAWHASELSRDSRAGHVGGGSGLLPDFSARRRKVGTPKRFGGFDAIIGNPPFIPIPRLDTSIRRYLERFFRTAVGRQPDLCAPAEV